MQDIWIPLQSLQLSFTRYMVGRSLVQDASNTMAVCPAPHISAYLGPMVQPIETKTPDINAPAISLVNLILGFNLAINRVGLQLLSLVYLILANVLHNYYKSFFLFAGIPLALYFGS